MLLKEILKWKSAKSPSLGTLLTQAPDAVREQIRGAQNAFDQLQQEDVNPLWQSAIADIRGRSHGEAWIGLVCTETRLVEPLRGFLETHYEDMWLWPVRPIELKTAEIYGQLVVLGPTQRYVNEGTDYIFKCPRASVLTLFTPDFFSARIPEPHDLLGSPHKSGSSGVPEGMSRFATPTVHENTDALAGTPVAPAPDTENEWIEALPKLSITYTPRSDWDSEPEAAARPVPARQVILTADHVVYLPEGGSVSHLCIDLENKCCTNVEHVDVTEIGSGDALLFSAEGGGDMVAEVADQLLGDEAARLRNIQRAWKSALGMKVASNDFTQVGRDLRDFGSRIASRANIRHWCSMWNIGPGTWRSFEAILRYCGLEDRRDEIFEATRLIRNAHRQAGAELSKKLREQMIGVSLEHLYSDGTQEFGGTIALPNKKAAFLVIEISPESLEVSPYDLLHPFEIQDKSWQ
ncbi:MAG: hypothetical protein KDL87_11360 [Verrucomicrobiae bacterium]|nr:hypothetical protein [Verrucomicrobiae bacterium]